MFRGVESVILFSESAKKLADFYKEKVGLTVTVEAEMGDKGEELYAFEFKEGASLNIVDHQDIKGKSQEPKRSIFNLEVDNIESEFERLVSAGINKIQDIYHVEGYGKIATFEDLDGNYFQIVQVREG